MWQASAQSLSIRSRAPPRRECDTNVLKTDLDRRRVSRAKTQSAMSVYKTDTSGPSLSNREVRRCTPDLVVDLAMRGRRFTGFPSARRSLYTAHSRDCGGYGRRAPPSSRILGTCRGSAPVSSDRRPRAKLRSVSLSNESSMRAGSRRAPRPEARRVPGGAMTRSLPRGLGSDSARTVACGKQQVFAEDGRDARLVSA